MQIFALCSWNAYMVDWSQPIIMVNSWVDERGSSWIKAFQSFLSKSDGLPDRGESLMSYSTEIKH